MCTQVLLDNLTWLIVGEVVIDGDMESVQYTTKFSWFYDLQSMVKGTGFPMQGSNLYGFSSSERIAGLGHPMELDSGNYLSMALMPIFIVTFIVIATISILIRIIYVISRSSKPLKRVAHEPLSTLIVLGSGGHTAEMINLLLELQKDRFVPRIYIAASTDNMSLQKARALETSLVDQANNDKVSKPAQFIQIYRSREVGQSYLTSIGTTLIAIGHALLLMIKIRPQVILCNGPGTCIPLCIIAFFFKVVGIRWSSIFYVESIARVRKLSLSGLLLYKLQMADQFFVQWPQLEKKYPRAHYVGCLM